MDTPKKLFGEKVFFFRKKRQYKQETLRDLSGVSQAEISRIERGRYQEIKVETIVSLAQAFEVDPDELVRGTEFATLFGDRAIAPNEPSYSGTPYTVYFASALTGLNEAQFKEIQNLDEQVHKICQQYAAHSLVLYRPRLKLAKFRGRRNAIVHDVATRMAKFIGETASVLQKRFDQEQKKSFQPKPRNVSELLLRSKTKRAEIELEIERATEDLKTWYTLLIEASNYVFQVEYWTRRHDGMRDVVKTQRTLAKG